MIKTENFRKYAKTINSIYNQNSRLGSHLYLDFQNSKATIHSSIGDEVAITISFDHTVDTTQIQNMYVSIQEFLAICNAYDELDVDSDFNFYKNDEKFRFSTFIDDPPDIGEYELAKLEKISLDRDSINKVINGAKFTTTEEEEEESNAGVRIDTHENVLATDRRRFYVAELSKDMKDKISNDFDFKNIFVTILSTIPEDVENIDILVDGNDSIIKYEDELYCYVYRNVSLNMPENLYDEDFVSMYDHPNYIVVKKAKLVDVLNFFQPFVDNERNERIFIEVDKEGKTLSIQIKGENIGNRYVDVADSGGEIEEQGIWISRSMLQEALSVINDTDIKLQIDSKANAYNVVGAIDSTVHVANGVLPDN